MPSLPQQRVDNYEYVMPADFEDEEIDEETAFSAEDKVKYAAWFEDMDGGDEDMGDEEEEEEEEEQAGQQDDDVDLLESEDEDLPAKKVGFPCGACNDCETA